MSVLASGNHERGDVSGAQVLHLNPAGPLPIRNKRPDQLHIAPDRRLGKPALGGQPAGIPAQQRLHRRRRPRRRHQHRDDLPPSQELQQLVGGSSDPRLFVVSLIDRLSLEEGRRVAAPPRGAAD
jgi:hypothetical protein